MSVVATEDTEPVHGWFSLSYCSYAVIPRSIAQSMPNSWQSRFVALMEEMDAEVEKHNLPDVYGYRCLAIDENGKFTKDFYLNYSRGRRNVFDPESNKIWG